MHPDIVSDKPGTCPRCGMNLVQSTKYKVQSESKMDHSMAMATPEAAADFLKRFFIVTALLVPLAAFSTPAIKYLGVPDFLFRKYVEFGIATIIFYFGLVFFRHAKMEIQMKQYGMMTLVSLGVGAGYLFSAISTFFPALNVEFYLEIATLIWVLLFGHYLEAKSSGAAGNALKEVAKLLPKEAHMVIKGGTHDVEIDSLKSGDIVLVKPGEKVPADGRIISGGGNVNESHITGESRPVQKKEGDEVPAGAISIDGSIQVELIRVGESSTIGQIEKLIKTAQGTKPSAQRLADRAARWLTFSALSASVISLLFWSLVAGQPFVFAATLAITVLVIACPHALGLAIPTVSTIATRLAVKNGVFIKDMGKIEVIKGATYVVFDKTGTLTKGNFSVTKVSLANSKSESLNPKQIQNSKLQILKLAAGVEQYSGHPIAKAIVAAGWNKGIKLPDIKKFKSISGVGVEGYFGGLKIEVKKPGVSVFRDGKLLGNIEVEDEIRPESKTSIDELHKLGIKVAMLTGDKKELAGTVSKKLGIDTVYAEVLPEDKYKYIKDLQNKGNIVVMAGDGVNDAPALTQANAGVAIGAGTDVAVEAGDVVLTQSNPESLVKLIVLSKKVYGKMLQNLFWAAGYNIIAIPAAAGIFIPWGFQLTPAVGALVMSLSSVVVVVNALSLQNVNLEIT